MKIIPTPWRGLYDNQINTADLPMDGWNAELDSDNLKISVYAKPEDTGRLERLNLCWNLFSIAGELNFADKAQADRFFQPKYKITPQTLLNQITGKGPFYASDSEFLPGLGGKKATVGIVLRWPHAEGGATNQLIFLAKELRSLGVAVTFYGLTDVNPGWARRESLRFINAANTNELFQQISEDVIIISTIFDALGLQLLKNPKSKRVIHFCQGIETYHHGKNPAELYAEKTLFDILHSLPLGRLSNSAHINNYFKNRFDQDCWNIPNALSEKFFNPGLQIKRPFSESGFIRMLWIGDPRNYLKGFNVLRSTFLKLKQIPSFPKTRLRLIIPSLLDPKDLDLSHFGEIELSMQIPQDNMPSVYNECDMLVSTSFYEGFGMPVLEAMALGLPVVTTNSMGLEGIIEDKTHALISSPGDSAGLAASVQRLIEDQELRNNLIKNGRMLACNFRSEIRKDCLIKTFSEILGRPLSESTSQVSSDIKTPEVKADLSNQVTCENQPALKSARPKFSVLMPTYNQAGYIGDSIQSVLNQTYRDFELVICDDGSTDNTPEVIRQYAARDPRIRYIRKTNGGTGSALNGALKESRGEWITWLSSDDLYEPCALEVFHSAINSNPSCRFFHGHYYILHDDRNFKQSPAFQNASVETPPFLQVLKLLENNHVNGITICIGRDAIFETGFFNEGNRNGQDYEMWLNLSARYPWTFIKERVAVTRLQPGTVAVAFPEAGIYDSAAGAQNFLNKYAFPAYFPLLDLKNPEQAWIAILSGIQLALKTDAFIYQGMGYVPAFLERMLEWISSPEQRETLKNLLPNLQALKEPLKIAGLPDEINKAVHRIIDCPMEKFTYKPYDPYDLMHNNMYSLKAAGRNREGELIHKFLCKVKRLKPGQADVAPVSQATNIN